ncbi:MAG: glycosyltransferase [Thermosynechococcaceae cyanobacterium MS004]|nr:glycosyltransferase [Thermosynechococcaceae cyanobacterium MS004]
MGNLYPGVECRVLYNPLCFPTFSDLTETRAQVRDELGTHPDSVVIIQSSRLERWKGHTLLLNALAQMTEVPNWICWIIGGDQRPEESLYLAELKQQIRERGITDRVKFWGQRRDVPQLLVAADIHCQPNTGPEPFGNTFVEALYAGLPVVTTAMGGAEEIVDSSCGRLVAPGDVVGLADTLKELVANPLERKRLGQGGPIRANQLCNPTRQLRELHQVLTEVIQKSA